MSTIRIIYQEPPKFPATDQHPLAERFTVRSNFLDREVIVDAIGGEPTPLEVDAVLNPLRSPVKDIVDQIIELSPARKGLFKAELAKL